MKILMPVLHYPPVIGGLEIWTQNIAERISKQARQQPYGQLGGQADVFVVTGKVENQPKKQILNSARIKRTGIISLKNLSFSSKLYIFTTLPFIFFDSLWIIKKQKIDILHCQGFLSGLIGLALVRIFRIPYITTVQSLQTSTFLKRLVYKKADVCIAASRAIADYFQEIGVPKDKIKIIPNGINVNRFNKISKQDARAQLGILQNDFVVVTVGRLEKRKGIKYLIKAMSDVQRQTLNIKLIIVGDGEERKDLEKMAKELGIIDKVKFVGATPNQDVPKYLAVGDCFCLPSLQEGFGIVVLEAMAAGLPVVATNIGGIKDLVENEKTGLLVPAGDSQAIANAIAKIQSNPDLAHALTQNAQRVLSQYDWQNITQQVFQIYQNTLNNGRQA